jgi:hypothetical protein
MAKGSSEAGPLKPRSTALLTEQVQESPDDDFEGWRIVAPLRNDEMRSGAARSYVLGVHRSYRAQVLRFDRGDIPAAILDVALDAPEQANVVVGIDEQAKIEGVSQRGPGKNQNTFDDDDRTRGNVAPLLTSSVRRKVVLRTVYGSSCLELAQMREQLIVVERFGLVEIQRIARGGIELAAIAIIPVVLDESRSALGHGQRQLFGHSRLPAARAARDTDHDGEHESSLDED